MADPEQLAAQVEAALPAGPAPGQPAPEGQGGGAVVVAASWTDLTPPSVSVLCCVVLPAWKIRPDEQAEVAAALAECLEQAFPGGLAGPYACWIRLLLACGAIAVSRVAMNGGKLPPLFLPPAEAAVKTAAEPAAPAREPAPLRPDQLTGLGI